MTRLPIPGSDAGSWGTILNEYLSVALNADGSLKDVAQSQVTGLTASLAAKANATRVIATGTGLTGGGDLSADRSLSVVADTTTQRIEVAAEGTLQGTRKQVNFIAGSGMSLAAADNAGSNRVDVTATAVPSAVPRPEDQGLLAWAFDPVHAVSFNATSSGAIALSKVWLRQAATVTNIIYAVVDAGTGIVAGQNFVGLYNSAGTRVGVSADQSANMGSAGTIVTAALTSPYAAAAGFYWVAFLTNATGSPTIARPGSLAVTGLAAIGGTAATSRFGTIGSGQTSLPSSFTPASIIGVKNGLFWAAIN